MKNNKSFFRFATILMLGMHLLLSSCSKVEKKEDLALQKLKSKATASIKQKDFESACEYLQIMVSKFPEDPKIGNYKLSLANCKFNNKEYDEAYQIYENFHQYYPSDKRAEYAKYKAALCKFNQSLDFDRDQSLTNQTIEVCSSYTQNPSYKKYRKEIEQTRQLCLKKIMDSELSICKFYIKHGKLEAAAKRLTQLRAMYGNTHEIGDQLLYLECKLANKVGDNTSFQKKLQDLTNLYPQSPLVHLAENMVQKKVAFQF